VGAECLFTHGVVIKIVQLMKVEQNPKIRLSLVRVLGNLARRCAKRAKQIVRDAGVPFFLNALNTKVERNALTR
jgi:hypothetical protein